MRQKFEPRILGFLCNWCCYAGADLAGVSRYQYPTNIRVIRVMCSGRVDPVLIFDSFLNGIDGVFIGGCWLGECHYVTQGNYHALSMVHLCKKLLKEIGVNPQRLKLEWVSSSEGLRFSNIITEFTAQVKGLGPLGVDEANRIKIKLEAAKNLVPYIKLVERERLRASFATEEEYDKFFTSEEVDKLFHELVTDKLTTNQVLLLLRERPLSTREIADILSLSPFEVSRCLNSLASEGLVKFDESWRCSA